MRALLLLATLAAPTLAQEPAAAPPITGELAKFQGFWKPESVEYDGTEQMPKPEQRQLLTLVIKGAEYRMYVLADAAKDEHYRMLTADLTLPAAGQFDIAVKSTKAAEQKKHGIYEFRGDKLMICYADAAKPRPTAFGAAKGSGQFLEIWVKEKKGPGEPAR